jgi:hypothetical protein
VWQTLCLPSVEILTRLKRRPGPCAGPFFAPGSITTARFPRPVLVASGGNAALSLESPQKQEWKMEEIMTYAEFLEALKRGVKNWNLEGSFRDYIYGLDVVTGLNSYLLPEDHKNAERVVTGVERMYGALLKKGDKGPDEIIGRVLQKLAGDIEKSQNNQEQKKKKKKEKEKEKENTAEIVNIVDASNAYETLCRYDAIYDLLTCNLHRLDPVIGDYGCQWRVPFILDLYDYVHTELLGGVFDDEEALKNALVDYAKYRKKSPSYDEISGSFEKPERHKSSNFQDEKVLNFMTEYEDFVTSLFDKCPGFAGIINWFEDGPINDWQGLPNTFDAYDYLMLCKLLTIGRIRMEDKFGLSARFNLSRNMPHSNSLLKLSIERLAIYSKIYMEHVTQSVCHELDIDIDVDTGLTIHEEGEPVHIAASCSDLMQIGRYQTSFNAQSFETHLFYGPFRSIFMHQHTRQQPIIVDIRRLVCRENPDGNVEDGTDLTYSLNGGAILYFEPDDDGNGFVYVPNPTEEQMNTVGMCVEGFSILNLATDQVVTDEDAVFYTEDFDAYIDLITNQCSIFDLIMVGGACHDETPESDLYFGDGGDLPLYSIRIPSANITNRWSRITATVFRGAVFLTV